MLYSQVGPAAGVNSLPVARPEGCRAVHFQRPLHNQSTVQQHWLTPAGKEQAAPGDQSADASIGEEEAPLVIGAEEVGDWGDGGDKWVVLMLMLFLFLTRRLRS